MTLPEFVSRLAAAALPYVLIIVTALFAWLSAAIVRLINAHVQNATVRGVLERVQTEVATAVAEVAQTTVGALKAGADDGKLTRAEAEAAADAAVSAARAYLGTEGVAALARVLGPRDVEAYIRARVEAEVAARKCAGAAYAVTSTAARTTYDVAIRTGEAEAALDKLGAKARETAQAVASVGVVTSRES